MLNGYGSTILEGAWLTLILALTSMAVAIVLGLLGAAFRLSPIKWLALLGETYATVIRGMSGMQVFFRILVPQMIRFAIPGFTNNWLVLTKATALISVVGLQDMMFKAKSAADATREPFTFYLAVAALYLVLTSVSLLALRYLEKRYSVGIKAADL
jgi:ABC-type arginine transport system permease subunit